MKRTMLKTKIHRATVTDANLDYEGSLTLDAELMEKAGILPNEKVEIYNITNGNRLSTYAIEGDPGSGVICANGAAAHLASPQDLIIIATYVQLSPVEAQEHNPVILHLDENNKITRID